MYDYDEAEYKRELLAEAEAAWPDKKFVTKDSGSRAEHPDGVVRDTEAGKPRFDLFLPEGVPFDEQLLTRVAWLYERGAAKYGDRNWEKSETEETLAHHRAAYLRHVFRFYFGVEDGEDHAAAVVWNVNAIDLTRRKIKAKADRLAELREKALKSEEGPSGQPWTPWQTPDIMGAGPNITPCETKTDNKFQIDTEQRINDAIKRLEETQAPTQEELVKKLLDGPGAKLQGWGADGPRQLKAKPLPNPDYLMDPRNWESTTANPLTDMDHPVNRVLDGRCPVNKMDWAEGDQLTELLNDFKFKAEDNVWLYSVSSDTWVFRLTVHAQTNGYDFHPDSARSFAKLVDNFGPLKVTKGKYLGLIFHKGGGLGYESE